MMLLRIFFIALVASAGAAQAQDLLIRSGDHPTFSRLTLPLPASQPWEAEQTEGAVILTLPGFRGRFDTSVAFERMRRDRIADLTVEGNDLILTITCACDASVFRAASLLVIDVADAGTPLAGPLLESQAAEATPIETARPARQQILPWIGGNSPFATSDPTAPQDQATLVQPTPETDRAQLLLETRQALIEEVATAASAGLLESSLRNPPVAPSPQAPPAPVPVTAAPLPEVIETPSENMRITSSMDMERRRTLNATTAGRVCPRENYLPVSTWGTEESFSSQLGPARNALMNARDNLDTQAALQLTRLYLYFGFGAEALDTLRLDPELGQAHPELKLLAKIFEYGSVKGQNVIGKYADCPSDVALWALVSFGEIPANTPMDTNAALRALNTLPRHLRQIIAPALSQRLLAYGDAENAAAAMRSIERLPTPLATDALLAQADLAINAGEAMDGPLEKIIDANAAESPEALVKLVEGRLARNEPISDETARLVEAYVQELRGTDTGYTLRKTQVIALSQAERFAESLDALEALAPSLSPAANTELTGTVLGHLAEKGEDFEFLEHVFAQPDQMLGGLDATTKLALATRLMDLGFAAQVQQLLSTMPESQRSNKRQLLAARAALGLEQPFQAQAALIGVDDPQAALMLAQAKEMAGAYREASELFAANNAATEAARAAWLSDDWRELMQPDAPEFGAIAAMGRATTGPDAETLGPLGLADRALTESSSARETLQQLLQSTAMPRQPGS